MIGAFLGVALGVAWAQESRWPYVVQTGDSMASVAARGGESVAALSAANELVEGYEPAVGEVLWLAGGASMPAVVTALVGTGDAYLSAGAKPVMVPLTVQLALPEGSRLCTHPDSYATLRLGADQNRLHDEITLLGGTCLTITGNSRTPGGRAALVELDAGSLAVRDSASTGQVTIRTRDGLTSASNGGFRVSLEEGATRTEALTRSLTLFGGGASLPLPANFGSRVRKGQVPDAPTLLLSPGTPIFPDAGGVLKRPDFTWSPVERALGYRVELSVDAEFTRLVVVEDVDTAFWFPEVLFLPFWVPGLWWRVSSFDRTGFLGVPSQAFALGFPAGIAPVAP